MSQPTLEPLTVPINADELGAWRVGSTRVLVEQVIEAFREGATPEAIVDSYETLRLADVYSLIGYYLTHPAEIEAYLGRRNAEAARVRKEIEEHLPQQSALRAKLVAHARKQE